MTDSERKQVVMRFNQEVIERGLRPSFDELMDPGFINWSAPPGAPRDAESMWNTFEHFLRPAIHRLRVQIHDQLCDDEKVVTRKTVSGMHNGILLGVAPTGQHISIDVIDIVLVRKGRYVEHWGVNTLMAVVAHLRQQ